MSDRQLEIALQIMSLALDNLIGECLDENGKPKAPHYKILAQVRGLLPPYCKHAFGGKDGSRV